MDVIADFVSGIKLPGCLPKNVISLPEQWGTVMSSKHLYLFNFTSGIRLRKVFMLIARLI